MRILGFCKAASPIPRELPRNLPPASAAAAGTEQSAPYCMMVPLAYLSRTPGAINIQ